MQSWPCPRTLSQERTSVSSPPSALSLPCSIISTDQSAPCPPQSPHSRSKVGSHSFSSHTSCLLVPGRQALSYALSVCVSAHLSMVYLIHHLLLISSPSSVCHLCLSAHLQFRHYVFLYTLSFVCPSSIWPPTQVLLLPASRCPGKGVGLTQQCPPGLLPAAVHFFSVTPLTSDQALPCAPLSTVLTPSPEPWLPPMLWVMVLLTSLLITVPAVPSPASAALRLCSPFPELQYSHRMHIGVSVAKLKVLPRLCISVSLH